jgi:hypothetical protein
MCMCYGLLGGNTYGRLGIGPFGSNVERLPRVCVGSSILPTAQGMAGEAERTMSWTETVSHIRAVLFEEKTGWTAQFLDYDLAAQAPTFLELQDEVVRVLVTHIVACAQLGREPFSEIGPAPWQFWELYDRGLRVESRPASVTCANVRVPPMTLELRIAQLATSTAAA